MAMTLTSDSSSRVLTFRRIVLGSAVAVVVAGIGLGGFIYLKNNSPHQLAVRARLAMEQHDPNRAIDFLSRALAKNPTGVNGAAIRNLMARALIETGREADARTYLSQIQQQDPTNRELPGNVAESYVHPSFRKFQQAPKPLSPDAIADVIGTIDGDTQALEGLPKGADGATTPTDEVAQAELQRLKYLILNEQQKQLNAARSSAQISQDLPGQTRATDQLNAMNAQYGKPDAARQRALTLLQAARKQDPKDPAAARLIAQYEYEDGHYTQAFAMYEEAKSQYDPAKTDNALSQPLVLTAANTLMADTAREPDAMKRYAAAQAVLEAYLPEAKRNEHPSEDEAKVQAANYAQLQVAIGQVMLLQKNTRDAAKMAEKAKESPQSELDAQLLLTNCLLVENNAEEAEKASQELINNHSGVPQVWLVRGRAEVLNGQKGLAADAFHKALALNPNFLDAKRELLSLFRGDSSIAVPLAAQILRDDRYDMTAWGVTVDNLRSLGQVDRARGLLLGLASDSQLPAESRPALAELLITVQMPDAALSVADSIKGDEADQLRLRAIIAADRGDSGKARQIMGEAVGKNPGNVGLRIQYADMLMQSNLGQDARQQLQQAIGIQQRTREQSLALAAACLRLRWPDGATQALATLPTTDKQVASLNEEIKAMATGVAASRPAEAGDTAAAAKEALDKKDYDQALTLARAGDRQDIRLHEIAAAALLAKGLPNDAVDEVTQAARINPNSLDAYDAFVGMFSGDKALNGIGFASKLTDVNKPLGFWAMGRLAENAGRPDLALDCYNKGLAAVDDQPNPATAKEALYTAVLKLYGAQKDTAHLVQAADSFSKDAQYAFSVRGLASAELLSAGDRAGAEEQLKALEPLVAAANRRPGTDAKADQLAASMAIAAARAWLNLGSPKEATRVIATTAEAGNNDAQLLVTYARLLEQTAPDKALAVAEKVRAADPRNPQIAMEVAQAQAASGDCPGAFATLSDMQSMGATGQQMAASARVRLLLSMGLLQEATQELQKNAAGGEDSSLKLAIGQAWAQLQQPEKAHEALGQIPPYAREYPDAQVAIAALDSESGKADEAIDVLQKVQTRFPGAADQLAGPLFQAYIRAGRAPEALELMRQQQQKNVPNSANWRNATLFAAAAAREGKQYDDALKMLSQLDPAAQKLAAMDIALLQLLANKPADASGTAKALDDHSPGYAASTVRLLAGATDVKAGPILASGVASAVYAALASLPPDQQKSQIAATASNPHVLAGDIDTLLNETNGADAGAKLRQLALAQRLVETGWSTAALDILDALDKSGTPLTLSLLQRHQALVDLHRTAEADKIDAALADRFKVNPNVAPSVRMELAAALIKQEQFPDALAMLEPLHALNRPAILTSLASIHEKMGQLEEAIKLHREVLKIDPKNVTAANNLAYVLAAYRPTDKATLAEARKQIDQAIKAAPNIMAFQDTLGYIEILSGDAEKGTRRIARALPTLRLDPAVHYHLGKGYEALNQKELAVMNYNDVQALANGHKSVPEAALAVAALKGMEKAAN